MTHEQLTETVRLIASVHCNFKVTMHIGDQVRLEFDNLPSMSTVFRTLVNNLTASAPVVWSSHRSMNGTIHFQFDPFRYTPVVGQTGSVGPRQLFEALNTLSELRS